MGTGAATGFSLWFSPGDVFLAAGSGGGLGLLCGCISLVYLHPLLRNTETRRSLRLVHGVAVPIGLIAGAFHPLLGAGAAFVAQLVTAVIANHRWPVTPVSYQVCESCGYSLRGLPGSICPECGGDISAVLSRDASRCHTLLVADRVGPCPTCAGTAFEEHAPNASGVAEP